MNIKLPKEAEDLDVLATLFSPAQKHIGILITGEDYLKEAINPIIRVYLMGLELEEWYIQDELQAFAFYGFKSAKNFVDDLPNMSALDLLLLMNGHAGNNQGHSLFQ